MYCKIGSQLVLQMHSFLTLSISCPILSVQIYMAKKYIQVDELDLEVGGVAQCFFCNLQAASRTMVVITVAHPICNLCFDMMKSQFAFLELENNKLSNTQFNDNRSYIIKCTENPSFLGFQRGNCEICLEERILYRTSLRCYHHFCQDCLRSYLTVFFDSQRISCKCPADGCKVYLSEYMLIIWGETRYLNGKGMGRFTLQTCVNRKCLIQTLMVEVDGDLMNTNLQQVGESRLKCTLCRKTICLKCTTIHRANKPCNVDRLFKKNMAKHHIKTCPKCRQFVQNEECGVDTLYTFYAFGFFGSRNRRQVYEYIVTCPLCQHRYCWRCNTPASILNQQADIMCKECYQGYFSCKGLVQRTCSVETILLLCYAVVLTMIATLGICLALAIAIMSFIFVFCYNLIYQLRLVWVKGYAILRDRIYPSIGPVRFWMLSWIIIPVYLTLYLLASAVLIIPLFIFNFKPSFANAD